MLEKLACLLACWLVFRVRAIFPVESSSRDWRQQKQNTPIFKQRLLVGFRGFFMF